MSDPISRLNAALETRYHIVRELGAGGMATVYLADDLRHERKVAIKVLKPELAALIGADRFLAEIRTTANLQHPHLLPLHDSGEAGGFLFYVMPFVEGESLRDRLDREKQLPVEEAVSISRKVAGALHAAHERGVVHRDIKPANILLSNGEPLIADFGIALAVRSGGSARLTETGMSLGTPQYMSPEQATGEQHVGPATDIYALGCLLYEMLVGEPPFAGSTPQAILGKILTGEPESVTVQRASVPPNVEAAVSKALERLPADRFRSARELAAAVSDPTFRHRPLVAEAIGEVRGKTWSPLSVFLLLTTLGLAVAMVGSPSRRGPDAEVARFTLGAASPAMSPVVSPDGRKILVRRVDEAGVARLWLRRLDDLTPYPIGGTEGAGLVRAAGFSPSGDQIAFVANDQMRVVGLDGGSGRALADSVFCCPNWGADGYIYFTAIGRHLGRVPAAGGVVDVVSGLSRGDGGHFDFTLLPDGDVGLFHVGGGRPHLESLNIVTGARTELGPGMRPILTETGHLVYATDGEILAVEFDSEAVAITGDPVPLVDDVHISTVPYPRFDLSRSGTLVYATRDLGTVFQPTWVTRDGRATPVDPDWTLIATASANFGWELSPDDSQLAVPQDDDIWIKDLPDGPMSRLTFAGEAWDFLPHWDPEGQTVTFTSDRSGRYELWSRSVDGAGAAERVAMELDRDVARGFWGPNGEWLILRTAGQAGFNSERDILAVRPSDGDSEPVPIVATDATEGQPALSQDGRWLAYSSNATGEFEVWVRPFPNVSDGQWQVSQDGGDNPLWSHDGRELFYLRGRQLRVARVNVEDGFRVTGDESLFEIPPGYLTAGSGRFYDVSRDGRRFLMAAPHVGDETGGSQVVLVQNLTREIGRIGSH